MYRKSSNGGYLSSDIKDFSGHWRKVIKITWASLSISSVSSVACTYMWSNCVGTVSIHMTRKISCTFVNIWEMTGFQSRFLEYDTCVNLLIWNTECISSSCSQLGLRIFHFLPLVKNIKARVTTLSKQTNKQGRKVQIKQTIKNTNTNKQVRS